jgi:hypothetical protein
VAQETGALGMVDTFSIGWQQFGAGITAIGALGMAAFGVVEALGKALAISGTRANGDGYHFGLPYAGLNVVKRAMQPLSPALKLAYGPGYFDIIAQQYRADRSAGRAPDTIRQGVRLALPFLSKTRAADVISSVWDMDRSYAEALAEALQAPTADTPPKPPAPVAAASGAVDPTQALAGRFATALDARVSAAFDLADERYESQAKLWAGIASVVLAVGFNYGLGEKFPMLLAIGIGIVAVPLAPVAKDLSTSLQNALTAFKAIPGGKA